MKEYSAPVVECKALVENTIGMMNIIFGPTQQVTYSDYSYKTNALP